MRLQSDENDRKLIASALTRNRSANGTTIGAMPVLVRIRYDCGNDDRRDGSPAK